MNFGLEREESEMSRSEIIKRKRELITALLSGEYRFGRGAMLRKFTDDSNEQCSWCFAGVACELYRLATLRKSKWVHYTLDIMAFQTECRDNSFEEKPYAPPVVVMNYFGIPMSEWDDFMEINDSQGSIDGSFNPVVSAMIEQWDLSLE